MREAGGKVFFAYTSAMADTTIKVDSSVRDRLAVLAAQRGGSIRDLVAELARATPTREEMTERHAAAAAYLREHLSPDLDDADMALGEQFWSELASGRVPASIPGEVRDRTKAE